MTRFMDGEGVGTDLGQHEQRHAPKALTQDLRAPLKVEEISRVADEFVPQRVARPLSLMKCLVIWPPSWRRGRVCLSESAWESWPWRKRVVTRIARTTEKR
jgi:hypothetical protein